MWKINHWYEEYKIKDEHLAIFRMAFALFYLLFSGFPRFDWLSSFPDFFYRPNPSVASIFSAFPPDWILHVLNIILPLLCIFIFLGFKTFWSSLLFGILFIIASSFLFAFGKINHSHLIPYTAILFAFSGWGKHYSIDQYHKTICFKFNMLPVYALILTFSYFTSGFSKLINGWLLWENKASYGYLIQNYFLTEEKTMFASYMLKIDYSLFWKFIDYSVVLIETFPLILLLFFGKRFFRFSLLLLAFFHLLVYLVFNISFAYYPLFFCVFIIDWEQSTTIRKLVGHLKSFSVLLQNKRKSIILLLLLFLSYICILYSGIVDHTVNIPFLHTLSLFLSFLLVVFFYVERKQNE